jgi:hypothetical protein
MIFPPSGKIPLPSLMDRSRLAQAEVDFRRAGSVSGQGLTP